MHLVIVSGPGVDAFLNMCRARLGARPFVVWRGDMLTLERLRRLKPAFVFLVCPRTLKLPPDVFSEVTSVVLDDGADIFGSARRFHQRGSELPALAGKVLMV